MSCFIVIQSVEHPDGYLTSDSAHYLQMAENLLAGDGMETASYVPDISTYFATWPIGYPVLIAGVSLVTFSDVFWASKILNIILLALSLLLIRLLFKDKAPFVALIFFVSTFTTLFSYTWSEVPFLFGLLWLVYSIVRYVETNRIGFAWQMLFAATFLFFMRYIGLIGAGIIGLVGFYFLFRKQWKNMLICWIAGTIPIVIAGVYLVLNHLNTGLMTGMERIPRAETASEFVTMLWRGILAEVNVLATSSQVYINESLILLVVALLLFIRPRHIKALFTLDKEKWLLPGMFLLVGIVYFTAIVYMRWGAHFDPFNYRLLGPATFMAWLFLASWFAQTNGDGWKRWRLFLFVVLGVALVMNVGYRTYTSVLSPSPDYADTKNKVTALYEEVPEESIVAFENIHARYLRTDLQFIKVHFQPYFATKETVDEFLERVTPNNAAGVYLENHPIREDRYHESFVELIDANKDDGNFIQID